MGKTDKKGHENNKMEMTVNIMMYKWKFRTNLIFAFFSKMFLRHFLMATNQIMAVNFLMVENKNRLLISFL